MSMHIILLALILCYISPFQTEAYDKNLMHISINESAANQSVLNSVLRDYGFPDGINATIDNVPIIEWIRKGGEKEDNPEIPRTFKHFHDPTQLWSKTTDNAKLSWTPLSMSSVRWAQDQGLFSLGGGWDWQTARKNMYKGLTSINESKREKYLAKSFEALGHIMHLIADMASPPHVRNDKHPGSGNYETYCKQNAKSITFSGANPVPGSIFQTSSVAGMEPITNLWDTDNSAGYNTAIGSNSPNIGLAEYTNYNFFSKDTVFDPVYTYPSTSMAAQGVVIQDPGTGDESYYFSGTTSDGVPVTHYAKMDYFYTDLTTSLEQSKISLDEECFGDYANILVPKAVNYNAALLDYFFRGKMDVTKKQLSAVRDQCSAKKTYS